MSDAAASAPLTDAITGPMAEYGEIISLFEQHGGRVTTDLIVEAAANPASAMHSHFTWDDTEAAHRYRLQQAGALLRRFRIVRQVGDRTIRVPAIVRMPDSANGYAPIQTVMSSDWMIQQRRVRLIGAMERLRDELRNWDEFAGIVSVLTEVLDASR